MHKDTLPELSLTEAISAESPYTPGPFVRFVARVVLVREEKFRDTGKLHSDGKIELFYKSVILILLITSAILAILGRRHVQPRFGSALSHYKERAICSRAGRRSTRYT